MHDPGLTCRGKAHRVPSLHAYAIAPSLFAGAPPLCECSPLPGTSLIPLGPPTRPSHGPPSWAIGHGGHWSIPSVWSVPSVWSISSVWSIPSIPFVSSGWSVSSILSQRDTAVSGVRGPISGGLGLRGTCLRATHRQVLAPALGRPQLSFGREGFPQVQILEDRSASSAQPLRETPPPRDHLPSWIIPDIEGPLPRGSSGGPCGSAP